MPIRLLVAYQECRQLQPTGSRVTAVAVRVADHGFALGGGNVLIAHGVIERPTEDVVLFTQ